MMYSANFFGSIYYGIGGAVSDSPMGPFKKYDNNPILAASNKISGPGHNSVVTASDGKMYCAYHAHTNYNNPGRDRQVYITPLEFENNQICLQHPEIR